MAPPSKIKLHCQTLEWVAQVSLRPVFVQQLFSMEEPLSPLSSRPKRSAVERSLCGCSFLEMFFDPSVVAGLQFLFPGAHEFLCFIT